MRIPYKASDVDKCKQARETSGIKDPNTSEVVLGLDSPQGTRITARKGSCQFFLRIYQVITLHCALKGQEGRRSACY